MAWPSPVYHDFLDGLASLDFKLWLTNTFSCLQKIQYYTVNTVNAVKTINTDNTVNTVNTANIANTANKINTVSTAQSTHSTQPTQIVPQVKTCEISLVAIDGGHCQQRVMKYLTKFFMRYFLRQKLTIQSIQPIQSIQANLAHLRVDFLAFFKLIWSSHGRWKWQAEGATMTR